MNDALVVVRIWLVRIGFALGSLLPLRRRVVLATAHSDPIDGNLAAIRRELGARSPAIGVRVLAHRPRPGFAGKLAAVLPAVRAGYQLARARAFIVDDYFFPIYAIRPRPGTTIVQVWHASGALKKFGYSLGDKSFGADAAVLRHVNIHANYDLCLVSSQRFAPFYAEAFGLPVERFTARLGIPRSDDLLDPAWRDAAATATRAGYALPAGRRVLLYAPTFRGDRTTEARYAAGLDLRRLREVIGAEWLVLLRLHPFVRAGLRLDDELAGFVVDVSDHPDIHALMTVADLFVTDYSSAIYEWSLLGRPAAFFAPDLAAYQRERGFYTDYGATMPGPIFDSTDALAAYVAAGEFDASAVQRFAESSFDVADGQASRRFVDEVVLPALGAGR